MLFNAPLMAVFWCLLLIFLLAGFVIYPSLKRRYPLAMIHLGCVLVLAGGLYGSERGHEWAGRLYGGPSFTKGIMQLRPGQSSDLVYTRKTGDIVKLPFMIFLDDAFIEYYDSPKIRFHCGHGMFIDMAPEIGKLVGLPDERGTVQIVKAFANLKLRLEDEKMVPYDAEDPGTNPAWELQVTENDGQTTTLYVFERFPMHITKPHTYAAEYVGPRMVKHYKSVLEVIEQGQRVKGSVIEVNRPLYYGGYHFCQNTFSFDESGPVSGLLVTSARGVWMVFFGYGLLFAGLAVQCWGKLGRKNSGSESRHGAVFQDPARGAQ